MTITVSSTAFIDGADIPRRYTCDGDNVSPPLSLTGLLSGTQDLALLVEDPDAPGGTFVHWVAWGIDPSLQAVAEGQPPPGTGTNGFGRRGYGGSCPPKGAPHFAVVDAATCRLYDAGSQDYSSDPIAL